MSTTTTICDDCGNAIPPSALGGICPFCLASSVSEELESRPPVSEMVVGPASYEEIGPYRILDRLGEGGYGVVYRAEQEGPLRRMVAIKILKGGAVSEQAVARFEAERQALAMMEHPAISHVYDVGETEEGLPYFVMELIEGEPISTYCEERGLSRDRRLNLFRQVCDAVGHAHRRGIIHRDLKPSNILVTEKEGEVVPKVIDFGIAKATETLLTERTLVTRDHQLVGTPAYMSPEQAAMTSGDIDTRSDIYSLGVLLYELLTGTTPFRVEELAELPYDEALRKVRTEDPQRPSSRCREGTAGGEFEAASTTALRLAISTDLDWIVMKALEKDRERRYETAGALARDVERFLEGQAIEARPPTTAYLAAKFVRKHRGPVLAATGALLAMVTGTIVSLVMFFRAEEQASLALANERQAEEQAERAAESDRQRILRFSHADMAQASPLLDDGRPALAVAHLARALQTNPDYEAAATRLLYTIAAENWALPEQVFPAEGPTNILFTPDGSRLLIATQIRPGISRTDPHLRIYDAFSGARLHEMELPVDQTAMRIGPEGKTVVMVTGDREFSEWNFTTGEKVRSFPIPGEGIPRWFDVSADGSLVACATWLSGVLHIVDRESGAPVSEVTVPLPEQENLQVAFLDEGRRLVVAFGTSWQVFETASSREVGGAIEHDAPIAGVAAVPGGERVVVWSRDGTAQVWNLESGQVEHVLAHEREIGAAAVSPDGSRFLTGTGKLRSESGLVRLWDLESGRLIGTPLRHPGAVSAVAFSADGMRAASGSAIGRLGDGAARVIDAWTGEPLVAPIYHPRGASQIAFSADGALLAIDSRHEQATTWSLRSTAMRPLRLSHGRPVWRAVFARDEERTTLVTQGFGGETRRWDAATGELLASGAHFGADTVAGFAASGEDTLRNGLQLRREVRRYLAAALGPHYAQACARCAAASEDGTLLAVGCAHGTLRLWSLESGKQVMAARRMGTLDDKPIRVTVVAFNRAGTRMVNGTSTGEVKLWSVPEGELLDSVPCHDAVVSALAISADGRTIASGSAAGWARFWWPEREPALGPPMDNRGTGLQRVNRLVFGPGDELLAVTGMSNTARLWRTADGAAAGAPMPHIDVSTYGLFAFWAPDGQRLVTTGSHDNSARVWNVECGSMVTNPLQHRAAATAAALHAKRPSLLFGGRHARVWDLGSGEPLTPLLLQDGATYSAGFEDLGPRFATGTLGGSAYLWDFVDVQGPLPETLRELATAQGGFRFNDGGVLEAVPGDQLVQRRAEVAALARGRSDSLGQWMAWLAEAPTEERTISPTSQVTLGEHVADLVKAGTVDSLREALQLRPGDPLIMGRLGYRIASEPDSSLRQRRFGHFLLKRAVRLAPKNTFLRGRLALLGMRNLLRSRRSEREGKDQSPD